MAINDPVVPREIAVETDLRWTRAFRVHPVHAMLVPVPIFCFASALVTDIAYWRTASMQWANFSTWLILAGILFSILAAVAGVVDSLRAPRVRSRRGAWAHGLINLVVLGLAIVNELIHTRDAYTSVVPAGLFLSALVTVIVLVASVRAWALVYRPPAVGAIREVA